jgi:tRNA U34 5-carboxymethylaminomethyl modifying GTPase MnmE/TrmE
MHEKEKIDNVKENSSNDNNKNIKNENEQEKEKILENVDIDKIANIDEDLNSSYVDEKEDFKKSNKNQFNVILIGDSNVGKTSILKKFITGSFNQKIQCTIDVEFSSKNLKIDKNLYAELKIFDTAGQEKYRALTKSY